MSKKWLPSKWAVEWAGGQVEVLQVDEELRVVSLFYPSIDMQLAIGPVPPKPQLFHGWAFSDVYQLDEFVSAVKI